MYSLLVCSKGSDMVNPTEIPSASFAPLSSSSRLTLTRLASYQEDFYIAAIPQQDASAYDRLLEKLRDKDFNPLNPFDVGFKGPPSFSLPSIDVRILEAPIPKVTLPGSLGGTFVSEINSRVAELVKQMYSSPAITFFEVVNHVHLEISYVQSRAICLS